MGIKKTTPVQMLKNNIKNMQQNIAYEKRKIVELESITQEDYEAFTNKIEDYMDIGSFVTMVADYNDVEHFYVEDFKMPPFKEIASEIKRHESQIKWYENSITDTQTRIKEKTNEAQIKKDRVIDALVDAGLTKAQAKEIIEKNSI
jgi:hypothetical protein